MSNDDDDAGGLAKRKIIHDQNMVVVDCANAKGEAQCDVLPKRCNMQYGETGQNKVIAHGGRGRGGDKDKIKMWVVAETDKTKS
jgi:hypothetical protein